MKNYYIFDIKKEFVSLYQNNPITLFNILNQIYYLHENDKNYAFNLFNQIANIIDKEELDKSLFLKLHKEMVYSKYNHEHIINDLFRDNISILKIKKTHMMLSTNKSNSLFLNILLKNNHHYFVCDFKTQSYFFLKDNKILV